MLKKILSTLVFTIAMSTMLLVANPAEAQTATDLPVMSATELAKHNGQNGNRAYFAYEGLIYDVTDSPSWKNGNHFGALAGKDLTGELDSAPHGTEVFAGFEVVATYAEVAEPTVKTTVSQDTSESVETSTTEKKWYEGRIKIFGLSILGWSGILMGVFFVLNFATCFALPWTKLPLPWKGSRPGPDKLDGAENSLRWGSFHKQFAWLTVVFGIIHGVLGFLQMLGYYL